MRVGLLLLAIALAGCQQKTPTAAVPIQGKPVNWGQGFGTQQPSMAPVPTLPGAAAAPTDWSGGDVKVGENLFGNLCTRCHGAQGKGGPVPGIGVVPNLTTDEFRARMKDADVANIIAHGKGNMTPFGTLDAAQLKALVAYLKTLKQ